MIAGSKDFICPPDEAWRYGQKIPGLANYITLEGATHDTFISYNGEEYVDLLTRELTAKRPEVYTKSTVVLGVDSGSKDGY